MTNLPVEERPVQRRLWLLPSFSTAIWLIIFLALMLLPSARVIMVAGDSDTFWHRQQGNWMLEHHAVQRTELFSYTRKDAPLTTLWWLSDIVIALAGNALGWSGIVLVAAIVCATCVWLLHRQLLAEGNELLLSTALTLLAASVCQMHWVARPHLATHFLVVIFAWQLRWFEQGRITARPLLILLPPLTALWANLHGAFGTAFVLIGVYFTGTVASWIRASADQRPVLRQRAKVLAVLGAGCTLASMLNPNGWKLLARVVDYTSDPAVVGFPQENLPPNFHDPIIWPFLLMGVVWLIMMPVCRPYLSVTDGLLLVVWFLLSLRMVRNAPLFALIAAPILAEHWNEYLRSASPSRFIRWYRRVSTKLTSVNQMAGARGLPVLAAIAMILALAKPQLVGGQPLLRTEIPADRYPVAAVRFLRQSPHAVSGEMFNEFAWGGYLVLALPERKVFVYPNLNVYGEEFIRDYCQVNFFHPGWEHVLNKYHIGWTIMPREHPLNRALAQRTDWRLVYTDPVTSIYGRNQ